VAQFDYIYSVGERAGETVPGLRAESSAVHNAIARAAEGFVAPICARELSNGAAGGARMREI
jgi:hypothetical protein